MKFHHKKTTITIYFLLFLLWMTLFINATEDQTQMIIENLSNDIQDKVPQCLFQNIFFCYCSLHCVPRFIKIHQISTYYRSC